MSMATNAKNARQRASIAINMIKKQNNFYRAFDDCFEMNDGDEVMKYIIEKTRKDRILAIAIKIKMSKLGTPEANVRLHEAIDQCLSQ